MTEENATAWARELADTYQIPYEVWEYKGTFMVVKSGERPVNHHFKFSLYCAPTLRQDDDE